MKTPSKITPDELTELVDRWLNTNATHNCDDKTWKCKTCGSLLKTQGVAYSIHSLEFGNHCAGAGQVEHFAMPFCPTCETKPESYGCLHVPYFYTKQNESAPS